MPRYLLAVMILIASLAVEPTSVVAQDEADLLIVGGKWFRTETGTFEPNRGITVVDGKFSSLSADPQTVSATATVSLDDGQYILPGIIDCHAHYNVKLIGKRREEFSVMPIIYLANGATVTFSCGEFAPEEMYELRRRIESGQQVGPRLINSGPYFGRARPGWRGKTEQEIFDEVDFWVGKGVGGFKAKAIGPAELQSLITRAHHHGLTVTGHLDSGYRGSVNPRDAIDMGIDRIEHFIGGDAMPDSRSAYAVLGNITAEMPEYQKAVKHFIENKTVFDATLTAYGYFGSPREEYEYWVDERQFFTPYVKEMVANRKPGRPSQMFEKIYLAKQATVSAFHQMGGTLTLGTDHVSNGTHLPGFGIHREIDAFVRNGISAVDAIRIATINGATALGIEQDHGSIDVGKSADLFVIDGNPLEDIRNTRNVRQVMTRGRIYNVQKLLDSVKGKLGPTSEAEADKW